MCASGDSPLGQRVEYQGYHGTVCFSGELEGQKGIWLGVDWDDPARGKHDGSHNGVLYFKARYPTSGSFVRPHRLNFGIGFDEAIRIRYGKVEGSTAGVDGEKIEECKRELNAPFIEMVGFDKINAHQSHFENLTIVCLRGVPVKCAGETGGIASLCPFVKELTLSYTLINSWRTLSEITEQLKFLVFLNISDNRLMVPSVEDARSLQSAFKSLRTIVINNLSYEWCEILLCANMWPSVTSLCVEMNCIHKLESPSLGLLKNLTHLSLVTNSIKDWSFVNNLGNLPSLQVLNVSETELENIFFPGERTTTLFLSLTELILKSNKIDNWSSINEINKLTSLQSLNINANPLLEEAKAWDLVIAKVARLKKLNGSDITTFERRGAEYDYMKCFGSEWLAAQNSPALVHKFLCTHPRYTELIEKHGLFTEDELKTASSPLKSRLIVVKIFCPNRSNFPEFHKKLPKHMTVQKLIGLVQKLMNTGDAIPSLRAISSKNSGIEVLLDREMQDLSYYSIEDGDSIAVSW